MIPVGFTLQPEKEFLELLDGVIHDEADYFEVAPETLWRADRHGALRPNGYHRRFAALREETAKPFVAHGVGMSMGTDARADAPRRRRWLARLREDQRVFRFLWYTDHLGASSLDGKALTLPVALPMTAHAATVVRRRLRAMQRVVADVGLENSVAYYLHGDPLAEPAFLARILGAPRFHLLLDLHNLYTMAQNLVFDPLRYLESLPLERVIEIHLSGGGPSDGAWLPSGRIMRLDSHDHAVPEEVWRLLRWAVPHCPRLRGVTLERMEGTVGEDDVRVLRGELRRTRRVLREVA